MCVHVCFGAFEFASLHPHDCTLIQTKDIVVLSPWFLEKNGYGLNPTDSEVRGVCWNSVLCSTAGWDLLRNAGKKVGEGSGDTS